MRPAICGGWLKGKLGVDVNGGASGFPGMGGSAQGRTIGISDWTVDVAVPTIGNPLGDAVTWVQQWLDSQPTISANLDTWILYLNDPSNVNAGDPSAAVEKEINKRGTIEILADWGIKLSGEPRVEGDTGAAEKAVNKWLGGNLQVIVDKITLGGPIGTVVGLPKALNDAANAADQVATSIRLETWGVYLIGNPINALMKASWGLGGKIADAIGTLDVDLPDWNLNLSVPSFPFLDAAKVIGWIGDAITGLGDLSVPVGFSMDLNPFNNGGGGEQQRNTAANRAVRAINRRELQPNVHRTSADPPNGGRRIRGVVHADARAKD